MHHVGGRDSATDHSVRAVGVLVCFPSIAGGPDNHLLLEADVFHLDRPNNQVFRLLDDHILQRNVLFLDLLAELEVSAGRLPKVHHPLFLGYWADHALRDVGQELQAPDRRHVGRFLHHPHVRQLSPLVIGKDDLLLIPVLVVFCRTVQIDHALLLGAEVLRSDH